MWPLREVRARRLVVNILSYFRGLDEYPREGTPGAALVGRCLFGLSQKDFVGHGLNTRCGATETSASDPLTTAARTSLPN